MRKLNCYTGNVKGRHKRIVVLTRNYRNQPAGSERVAHNGIWGVADAVAVLVGAVVVAPEVAGFAVIPQVACIVVIFDLLLVSYKIILVYRVV